MYDQYWAQDVYYSYVKLTPRVQQIDNCIEQEIFELGHANFRKEAIPIVLWDSIRGGKPKGLWYQYKRLVAIYPLDKARLKVVSTLILEVHFRLEDERHQLLLNFC